MPNSTATSRPDLGRRLVRWLPPRARAKVAGVARRLGLSNGKSKTGRAPAQTPVVRFVDWDTVQVAQQGARRRHRLSDRNPGPTLEADVLRIRLPEPSALERLTASGVLRGRVRELRIEIETMPPFLRGGLRAPGTGRDSTLVSWQSSGSSVEGRLGWRRPKELDRALEDALTLVLRRGNGRLERAGGPDVTSIDPDPTRSTNPELATSDPDHGADLDTRADQPGGADRGSRAEPTGRLVAEEFGGPLGTSVAFPIGRAMVGPAARYRLEPSTDRPGRLRLTDDGRAVLTFDPTTSVEQPLLDRDWRKYATVEVDHRHPEDTFGNRVLLGLAACGVVLVPGSDAIAARLHRLGLVTAHDPATVTDVDGYRISAAASRAAALIGDPLLARSRLAAPVDGPEVPLPTISVLIASKREEDVRACLTAMAAQDYPAFEVLVGTHGYRLAEDVRRDFEPRLSLRTLPIDQDATLGQLLGTLTRAADGDLLAKVDDDDHYGADHLSDLMLALRCSGADLVAKSARFVRLADTDVTIDRTWSAPEAFEVVPAGGTILVSRAALSSCGGWSESPRHVDAELIQRIRSARGATYRTHGLGYVYVRRNSGHTWQADPDSLRTENEVRYSGLPAGILTGGSW